MKERLDLYLGFDKDFFHTERWEVRDEERFSEIDNTSSDYLKLLESHSELLNRVLDNQKEPEELGLLFYKKLNRLCSLEKVHSEMIRKGMNVPRLLESFGYDKESPHHQYYCGRVGIHLVRLILPEIYSDNLESFKILYRVEPNKIQNTFCKEFGISYLRFSNSRTPEDSRNEGYEIMSKIGTEGMGVFDFWTIAPYVYTDFIQRGNNEDAAVQKIFSWILKSQKDDIDFRLRYLPFRDTYDLWRFSEPLGLDERMPTHLRARLLSKETAKDIEKYLV